MRDTRVVPWRSSHCHLKCSHCPSHRRQMYRWRRREMTLEIFRNSWRIKMKRKSSKREKDLLLEATNSLTKRNNKLAVYSQICIPSSQGWTMKFLDLREDKEVATRRRTVWSFLLSRRLRTYSSANSAATLITLMRFSMSMTVWIRHRRTTEDRSKTHLERKILMRRWLRWWQEPRSLWRNKDVDSLRWMETWTSLKYFKCSETIMEVTD